MGTSLPRQPTKRGALPGLRSGLRIRHDLGVNAGDACEIWSWLPVRVSDRYSGLSPGRTCQHAVMETQASGIEMFLVRVGDAERDACIEALAEHHIRGRLSVEELDRRQRAALNAVTAAASDAADRNFPSRRTHRSGCLGLRGSGRGSYSSDSGGPT